MIENELNDIAEFIVEIFKAEIIAKGKVASGNLLNSVESVVTVGGSFASVDVFADKYFDYIVSGRKAGYPSGGDGSFLRALIEWVKAKGLETDNKAATSAAYAIRESIFKNGVPAVDLVTFAEQEIEKKVTSLLIEGLNKEFEKQLDKAIL